MNLSTMEGIVEAVSKKTGGIKIGPGLGEGWYNPKSKGDLAFANLVKVGDQVGIVHSNNKINGLKNLSTGVSSDDVSRTETRTGPIPSPPKVPYNGNEDMKLMNCLNAVSRVHSTKQIEVDQLVTLAKDLMEKLWSK